MDEELKTLVLDRDELLLVREAMQRFTRSVGGDMARAKDPDDEIKDKMTSVIALGDRINNLVDGGQ